MESKLVSVIMPAFNGEKFIQQAIESVLAQSYSNWELIVVDDGSTDNTAFIVKAFKDPRIQYVYQENHGQAAALNCGLDLAHGHYITTLDVDDWFTVESLADRVCFLEQSPQYGVVYGDGYYCDVNGKPLRRFSEYRVNGVVGDVYDILISAPFYGTGGNVMVRREVFDQYNIRYDESIVWCQDYDTYIRIAERASFGVVATSTIWYRIHEENMTMAMPVGRRLESLIRTKFKVLASSRFDNVPTALKIRFFYIFLTQDLHGRLSDQKAVVQTPHFRSLPREQRSRLLRMTANTYLLRSEDLEVAKNWIHQARSLMPLDPKNLTIAILLNLKPEFTKLMVRYWRKLTHRGTNPLRIDSTKGITIIN